MKIYLSHLISFCLIFCFTLTACTKIPPQNTEAPQSTSPKNEVSEQTAPKNEKYAEALSLIEKKDYGTAYAILKSLGDYEDVAKYLSRLRTVPTSVTITNQGKEEFFYNENGLLSKHISIDEYGRKDIAEFTYDQNNNLLQEHGTSHTGAQTYVDYTYNENGNLICKKITNANGSQYIEKSAYDQNDRLLRMTVTYADGKKTVTDYIYDTNGYLVRNLQTGPNAGDFATINYIYDHNGNLIQKHSVCTYTTDNGSLQSAESIWECDYDAKDNPTMEAHTDIRPEGDLKNIIEYTYDSNGNLTRKVTTDIFSHAVNSPLHQSTVRNYIYDENGFVIQMDLTDNQGIKSIFTFDYDKDGNMVKETAGQRVDLCTYDESGNMTKLLRTFEDGTSFSVESPHQWVYLPEKLPEATEIFLAGYFNRNYRTPIF